ncbi:hypothetical protein RB595_002026 [Gaeumannomyces hyphopodioides]
MQLLSTLLLAASASASSLQARQYPLLYVSNYTAACTPHSVRCHYSFGVQSQPILGWTPTKCDITLNGPDMLPEVNETACEQSYRFGVKKAADGGLDLTVWLRANSRVDQDYCHHIPADQLVVDDNGAVQTQRYTGPTDFEVVVAECARS